MVSSAMPSKLKSILPPKWKLATMLSVSFASAFTLFFYTPFDIYLHNPSDFIIGWKFLLPLLLAFFLVCFLAILILLLLVWHRKIMIGVILLATCGLFMLIGRFAFMMFTLSYIYMLAAVAVLAAVWVLMIKILKENAFDVVVLLISGILIAAYIQTLFLNGNMIMIKNEQTEYSLLTVDNIINLLIWSVITLLPLCIFILLKIKKKVFRVDKVLTFSMVIILGMQSVGLVITAATTDIPEGYDEGQVIYKSYEATSNLSNEKNILVFILDRMDVAYMREALERYPHLKDYLDGFTHYENNITEYWDTFPSVTSMLTHNYYKPGQTYTEYWEESWAQYSFIDNLKENGFTTNMFLDYSSTYGSHSQLQNRADNLIAHDKVEVNFSGFTSTISRLSLGRLSPYLLKDLWLPMIAPNFGNSLFHYPVWVQQPVIGIHSDLLFHGYIQQAEFTASSDKSVFTIMHLNGAHVSGDKADTTSYGLHFDDISGSILFGGDVIDSTRVTLEILNGYFEKLKGIGVYDLSTIILLADHGYERVPGETASLLIKPVGCSGVMQIDTETELSHKYFGASVLDAAGLPYGEFGISYFDLIDGMMPSARILYSLDHWFPAWTSFGTSAILELYGYYEVSGDANVPDNWVYILFD